MKMSELNYNNEQTPTSLFELSIMLVAYLVMVYLLPSNEAGLSLEHPDAYSYVQECVSDIIRKYFHNNKELTIVNMNTENEGIFKIINNVEVNSITLRESHAKLQIQNEAYFIAAGDYADFIKEFPNLTKEIYWNPTARFLIMIRKLPNNRLRKMFDLLLVHSVKNVLIMNESDDPNLYTYNPFEDYGCGQRYDKIKEYGKCSKSQENLYPNKLVTGLRNCTFKVVCPHWPPYSIDPTRNNGSKLLGVEEVVLREMGKQEHFQVQFIYTDDAEIFSTIENDVIAIGPLDMLQKREVDIMMGGMVLTHQRARAFDYLWGHLAQSEEIVYQVKQATAIASWKNTYAEFDLVVWTVFFFAFLGFFLIFVIFVRPKDKGRIILKMIGYLFLAGNGVRGNFFTKYLFIHWVVLAYIINVYYMSNLVSFTTNPVKNYQVSNEEDLIEYNMQPCVSSVIKEYLESVGMNDSLWTHQYKGCENLLQSIKTVSESDELYTVVVYSLYRYNRYCFYDEWGDSLIYTFKRPLTQAIYAIYMYKGFPMQEKLHTQTLRMSENGLIGKILDDLNSERRRQYQFNTKEEHYYLFVPWYILTIGHLLSAVVFVIEIIVKKYLG